MTYSSRIKRYFWTGLLVIVPAWGTFLILYTLFDALDHMTVDVFQTVFDIKVPGSGIASFCLLVLMVGVGMTHFVGHRIHMKVEESFEKIPLVRSIYNTLKGMADVLNFRERFGHSKVVAFPFPRDGLWALGFCHGICTKMAADFSGWPAGDGLCPNGHSPIYRVFGVYSRTEYLPRKTQTRRSHENGVFGGTLSSASWMANSYLSLTLTA